MATHQVYPGTVTVDGGLGPHTGSGVTGAPPQWADDTDATYATIQRVTADGWSGTDTASAPCPSNISGRVTKIVAHVRAAAEGTPDPAELGLSLYPLVGDGFADADVSIPADGVTRDFDVTMDLLDNPSGWMNVAVLNLDVTLDTGLGGLARIYEVSFTVTAGRPRLRNYPTDRGRNWPPDRNHRNVGGQP